MHPVVVAGVTVVVVESVPSSVVSSVVVVDEDSSEVEVEAVSAVESSDLAQEFIFRLKKKISNISINTSFR